MKKPIQKFSLILLFFVFYAHIPINAQVTSQFLNGKKWQLQNPIVPSNSELIYFIDQTNFDYTTKKLNSTAPDLKQNGTYSLSGNSLIMTMDNRNYIFTIVKLSDTKISLSTNGTRFIYARLGSIDDNYFVNFLNHVTYNPGDQTPVPDNVPQTPKQESCHTCHGTGDCIVCYGSGITSNPYTGKRSMCSACGGTGKCWHCFGTGKQ
jgi:hypothetical protein